MHFCGSYLLNSKETAGSTSSLCLNILHPVNNKPCYLLWWSLTTSLNYLCIATYPVSRSGWYCTVAQLPYSKPVPTQSPWSKVFWYVSCAWSVTHSTYRYEVSLFIFQALNHFYFLSEVTTVLITQWLLFNH